MNEWINNQHRAIQLEFQPVGFTLLKNPLDAMWGLLPTLWWVGSWLPTYLVSFFPSSREKISQRDLNRQPLGWEMGDSFTITCKICISSIVVDLRYSFIDVGGLCMTCMLVVLQPDSENQMACRWYHMHPLLCKWAQCLDFGQMWGDHALGRRWGSRLQHDLGHLPTTEDPHNLCVFFIFCFLFSFFFVQAWQFSRYFGPFKYPSIQSFPPHICEPWTSQ